MPNLDDIKKLGRYDIVRILGQGAMGVVYEANDPNLNRKVAIKTVRVGALSSDDAKEYELRFRTEAHSAARLQHPNIVSVYDSDRDGDTAYLVMEFVKGQDLKHFLDSGHRYALQESVSIVCDLLAALEYAHEHKIIHRDIKPANLLVEPNGRVKLADFGVARIQDSGEMTRTHGGVVGTLKYMSPEQADGRPVDARSDLFSAGIVLYQLLTDSRPFDGDSYFAIFNQITNLNPPPPTSINPMLPTELDAVLTKALSKNRVDRYDTAHDFAFALRTAARQADPTITPSARSSKFNSQFGSSHSGGSFGSTGAHSSSSNTSNTGSTFGNTSTITQEAELVYWKDVKDSTDTRDFEVFLSRFPNGIYAELSKRQIQKILDTQSPRAQATASMGSAYDKTQISTDALVIDLPQAQTKSLSDDPTRTSMFDDFPRQGLGASASSSASNPKAAAPPMSPTGSALVALQSKMQTPMVIKPAERKAKSNGLAWAIGFGALLLTLLACTALWFFMAQDDGPDIIMFSDVLKVSPKN